MVAGSSKEEYILDTNNYTTEKDYNEQGFLDYVMKFAGKIGIKLVNEAFELYYVTKKPECPMKVKAVIYGALAYLALPIDAIPDMLPVVGYTDDAAAIAMAIAMAHMYIDEEVERKAYERIVSIFGEDLAATLK